MKQVIAFLKSYDGIGNKDALSQKVMEHFALMKSGSVYHNSDFALRFCQVKKLPAGNTVISLSTLLKYDREVPFLICAVTPEKNEIFLANTYCLEKVSHSSVGLTEEHICGSFNFTDIRRRVDDIPNIPENFDRLYALHMQTEPADALQRLVIATSEIRGTKKTFHPTEEQKSRILQAPARAIDFIFSPAYQKLLHMLTERVQKYRHELILAANSSNINLRGRMMETLITKRNPSALIDYLRNGGKCPPLTTPNKLGDLSGRIGGFQVAVDIKSKLLYESSAPKAYNIDKTLSFLAEENTVFMFFFLGITEKGEIKIALHSPFQTQLLQDSRQQNKWAGRNTRGTIQFSGRDWEIVFDGVKHEISEEKATAFLKDLLGEDC